MKTTLKRCLKTSVWAAMGCMALCCMGPAVHAKTIELSLSHSMPPIAPAAQALEQWAKKLEAETNGELKFTIYPAASLVKNTDAYVSTAAGICDIAFINNSYEPSRWGLNNIIDCPALEIPTDIRGTQIWDKLWEKFPEMVKEYKGVKVLSHSVSMAPGFHTKKLVRKPEDLKNMKIAVGGNKAKYVEFVGASPVGMGPNDWYLALDKGVIDGIMCPIGVITDRGIEPITPYHLDLRLGQGGNSIVMNLDKWKSLPENIKAKIESLNSWLTEIIVAANNRVEAEGWEKCRKLNQSIIVPTPEESKVWFEYAKPLGESWIQQNAGKGPTKEIYEYASKLAEEMAKK